MHPKADIRSQLILKVHRYSDLTTSTDK